MSLVALIRERALDAQLAALLWLLVEARTPLVITGSAPIARRKAVADALIELPPGLDDSPPALAERWEATLSARLLALRPGDRFVAVVGGESLRELLSQATDAIGGLTDDEARALGLVVVLGADGRVDAAHLLRPVERDAEGHLQRRPPAVLAARDPSTGTLDHFAWGVAPELADRLDVSERDLDRRLAGRAGAFAGLADAPAGTDVMSRLVEHLASEPPREPAPERPRARDPWPARTDPDHVH